MRFISILFLALAGCASDPLAGMPPSGPPLLPLIQIGDDTGYLATCGAVGDCYKRLMWQCRVDDGADPVEAAYAIEGGASARLFILAQEAQQFAGGPIPPPPPKTLEVEQTTNVCVGSDCPLVAAFGLLDTPDIGGAYRRGRSEREYQELLEAAKPRTEYRIAARCAP